MQAEMLTEITLHEEGGGTMKHIVSREDVERFVEACLRLHHSPGINPHNNAKTVKVVKITRSNISQAGPFWWSTPDLQNNDDPKGAKIWGFRPGDEEVIWPKE